MKTEIQKWGNSLALRIPGPFAAETNLKAGTSVDLTVKGGKLIVSPRPKKRYRLADLVEGISSKNSHSEQWPGNAQGNEAW